VPVTTFLLPVEGLTITCPWEIGRVQLYPGAQLRSLLGDNAQAMLGHKVIGDVTTKFVEELEQGTVARVEATDIDAALDLLTLATDLLRVFLKKGAQFRTTMFGLPGQMYRSQIRYVTDGAEAGPGIRNRGEAVGVTFDDARNAAWLNSPTFTTLASLVGTDHPLDERPRRALLGVQLLSQAVLEHRPAFKMLNLVIALESMLLERDPGTQTLRFLRRATYFTSGRAIDSLCGRDRPPCQFLGGAVQRAGRPRGDRPAGPRHHDRPAPVRVREMAAQHPAAVGVRAVHAGGDLRGRGAGPAGPGRS
jgi:hypothetical protein